MKAKRIFYITTHGLSVAYCRAGEVHIEREYTHTADQLVEFEKYLQSTPDTLTWVLVDVIEEEFHRENVPHVIGKDRQAVLDRKCTHHFRNTPYRGAIVQGREKQGRRDDKILLMGITNPDILIAWMERVEKHKVPLVGIYSLPLLVHHLMKALKIKSPNALVITEHKTSGLRQTFIQNFDVKSSRVTPRHTEYTDTYAANIVNEVYKNQRYMIRLRLLPADAPLDIYILSQGERLQWLEQGCVDTDVLKYHFIDERDIGGPLGLRQTIPVAQAEKLFIYLLSKHTPPINFARAQQKRYFNYYWAKKASLAASILFAVSGVVMSGMHYSTAVTLSNEADAIQISADDLQGKYEEAVARLPATPAQARIMQHAVKLADTLRVAKPKPVELFKVVSYALHNFSDIRIEELIWIVSDSPAAQVDGSAENTGEDAGDAETTAAADGPRLYQIGEIGASFKPFEGNFRYAFSQVEKYAGALRRQRGVIDVKVLQMPIDINPSSTLSLNSGLMSDVPQAIFRIRVVVGDKNA